MTCHACLFEAKSIQDYILRSGRLRHIVGASELIDALTRELLDDVLGALDLRENSDVRFSRRAGGAIYLFASRAEARDAFRDLWTLTVRQYAPGLEFVVASGEGETDHAAYEEAQMRLQSARNRQAPALPAGTPVTRYAPRTGLPAVKRDKLGLQDQSTARFGQERFWQRGGLTKRFAPDAPIASWPRDLQYHEDGGTLFPFLPDSRYLGLLHADGNGLGQLLMALGEYARAHPETFVPVFRDFSEAIERATQAAAQAATQAVLGDKRPEHEKDGSYVYPARPIVLGGDDLTMLIRADLALPFARAFLEQFETTSRQEMKHLRDHYPDIDSLPEALTAGAGIAFVKSNHPFYMAHEVTEGLAKFAKDRAKQHLQDQAGGKRIPPTLAFYRVTTSSHGDYHEIRRQEQTFSERVEDGQGVVCESRILTTLGAYGIDPYPPGLPALKDLEDLAALFASERLARGPARQMLTLIGQDLDEARRRYARWQEVMKEREPEAVEDINDLLTKLCGALDDNLPVAKTGIDGDPPATPLGDVASLLAIGKGTPVADRIQNTNTEATA